MLLIIFLSLINKGEVTYTTSWCSGNTLKLHLGDAWLRDPPEYQLSRLSFFMVFLTASFIIIQPFFGIYSRIVTASHTKIKVWVLSQGTLVIQIKTKTPSESGNKQIT
jgi:hypothetical protein